MTANWLSVKIDSDNRQGEERRILGLACLQSSSLCKEHFLIVPGFQDVFVLVLTSMDVFICLSTAILPI